MWTLITRLQNREWEGTGERYKGQWLQRTERLLRIGGLGGGSLWSGSCRWTWFGKRVFQAKGSACVQGEVENIGQWQVFQLAGALIGNRILWEIRDKIDLYGAQSEIDLGAHLSFIVFIYVCKRQSFRTINCSGISEQGRLAREQGRVFFFW